MAKRRAIIKVSAELLQERLGLADGYEVIAVRHSLDDAAIGVFVLVVSGPGLPECGEGMEPTVTPGPDGEMRCG